MPQYRKAHKLLAEGLPEQARKAVIHNVTVSEGPWVMINLAADPVVVIPSRELTAQEWLDAMCAIRDQTEAVVA
jgi:hypothetical protein